MVMESEVNNIGYTKQIHPYIEKQPSLDNETNSSMKSDHDHKKSTY